jgi:Na+/H+-translocating membrane pyrophosphatase
MTSTITGIVLGLFFNNAGGAWDNAKKYIEGQCSRCSLSASFNRQTVVVPPSCSTCARSYIADVALYVVGAYGGKGSAAHAAAVMGDTVGDPFKGGGNAQSCVQVVVIRFSSFFACLDTAGPSLHVLIKLLATIALVLGPLQVD